MARIYNIDNPSPAAESFGRWLEIKTRLPITARQVMTLWVYNKDWEGERRDAGRPFTNRTHSVDDPSEPATAYAAFLAENGIAVDPPHIQAMWKYHREWQSSPERRAERGAKNVKANDESPTAPCYFILNQREVLAGDDGYDDVEGQRYHWTSQSSGAWKRLSESPGARFVYYRPGTASDGTTRSYFGIGMVAEIQEPVTEGFVATISDFVRFDRPVPSAEGPSINHQTSILPITKADFDKLVRLGNADVADDELTLDAIRDAATKANLRLDDAVYAQLAAALLSEKHVILTGPPGTAKTTLAQAVAEAAQQAGLCTGVQAVPHRSARSQKAGQAQVSRRILRHLPPSGEGR